MVEWYVALTDRHITASISKGISMQTALSFGFLRIKKPSVIEAAAPAKQYTAPAKPAIIISTLLTQAIRAAATCQPLGDSSLPARNAPALPMILPASAFMGSRGSLSSASSGALARALAFLARAASLASSCFTASRRASSSSACSFVSSAA